MSLNKYIIKRDGRKVEYNRAKIENAMRKAFVSKDGYVDSYGESKIQSITNFIEDKIYTEDKEFTVEEIQTLVQNGLMNTKRKDIAEEYIIYRNDRTRERQRKSNLMMEVGKKLNAKEVKNQNANVDEYSFGGKMGEARNVVTKEYALTFLIPKKMANNHYNNRIYLHDLDSYAAGNHNCLSCPFDHMLLLGFNTRQTDVRGARSINTAMQLVAVIFQLQSLQQFGGVSATHLDWTLVRYVRLSFFKHYLIEYLKHTDEIYKLNILEMSEEDLDDWIDKNKKEYLTRMNLTEEDFTFDNENLDPKFKQIALFETRRETYQAAEALQHNLNTLQSRSGNQLPFSSINYGTCTLPEGRLIIRALLETTIKGNGSKGRTSIFPCVIFTLKKGVNRKPGDPNYDLFKLALKSTAKRLYPNYCNGDFSGQIEWVNYDRKNKRKTISELSNEDKKILIDRLKENPELGYTLMLKVVNGELIVTDEEVPVEFQSTMGCRTINGADINAKYSYEKNIKSVINNGKLYDNIVSAAQKDGRGNIVPSTIIMPTLAMEAVEKVTNGTIGTGEAVEEFMSILNQAISDCKDGLIERFNYIASRPMSSAKFMYENNMMYGYVPEEGIISALKHGTLAIGQIGLAETLQILLGCDQTGEKGLKLAERIEQLFKDRCAEYKEKYKLNFGVYFTPAENLCYTAMAKFKDKYGAIPNVSENDFFTNSMHVPVWKQISPFQKIDIECKLTKYSSAGCITYIELDSSVTNNLDAIEIYVNYAMDHDIPYFAINVPNDTCLDCGYIGEFKDCCPICGGYHIQRLRRVTGYLTGDFETAFNPGKVQEAKMRYQHTKRLVDPRKQLLKN